MPEGQAGAAKGKVKGGNVLAEKTPLPREKNEASSFGLFPSLSVSPCRLVAKGGLPHFMQFEEGEREREIQSYTKEQLWMCNNPQNSKL